MPPMMNDAEENRVIFSLLAINVTTSLLPCTQSTESCVRILARFSPWEENFDRQGTPRAEQQTDDQGQQLATHQKAKVLAGVFRLAAAAARQPNSGRQH